MTSRWEDPRWVAEAHAWIGEQCERLGVHVSGEITQPHVRPWATALRVPTGDGALFFKATAPPLAHETALTVALARWYPESVLPVLAADVRRAWMLMPDGGARLRELPEDDRERRWLGTLPRYAEMQIDSARHRDEMLALGVPDRRSERVPEIFDSFFENGRFVGAGTPYALSADELRRLRAARPRIVELSEELAHGPIPAGVQHDDLHDGNVLVNGDDLVIFDWGDASVAHPFFSLRIALGRREPVHDRRAEDRAMAERAREAYLEPWTRFAPRARLAEIVRAARVLGIVARIPAWELALHEVEDLGEHAQAFPTLLRELLETVSTS